MRSIFVIAARALGFVAVSAALASRPIGTVATKIGKVLTDLRGMMLFAFDEDDKSEPVCYDKCMTNWPPLLAEVDAKAAGYFGLGKGRADKKLYRWMDDHAPAEMSGDRVWHIAKPD